MKAIVLSCDRYRPLTDHMIRCYEELWPGHPFRFRVPYQHERGPASPRREHIASPEAIKPTVLRLLEDLPARQWVYWCIDDKYPIEIEVAALEAIYRWIVSTDPATVSAVLPCRARRLMQRKFLTGRRLQDDAGRVYLERRGYQQIWLHQFIRVEVLRHLFNGFPDTIPTAKGMDRLKSRVAKPPNHRLFVVERNLAIYGESTYRGQLTQNCRHSLLQQGLHVPAGFPVHPDKNTLIGTLPASIDTGTRGVVDRLWALRFW